VTEAADKHVNPELKAWFEAWETCTQTVLSQIFGHPVTFETPSEAPPGADSDLWYTVVAGGALRGEMTLRLTCRLRHASRSEISSGNGTPWPSRQPNNKEALEETSAPDCRTSATALASAAGGEVQFHVAASSGAVMVVVGYHMPFTPGTKREPASQSKSRSAQALAAALQTTRGSTARIRVTSRPTVAPARRCQL